MCSPWQFTLSLYKSSGPCLQVHPAVITQKLWTRAGVSTAPSQQHQQQSTSHKTLLGRRKQHRGLGQASQATRPGSRVPAARHYFQHCLDEKILKLFACGVGRARYQLVQQLTDCSAPTASQDAEIQALTQTRLFPWAQVGTFPNLKVQVNILETAKWREPMTCCSSHKSLAQG